MPERIGPIRNKPVATQLLERGVETAYMVVEEYLLRGRQAAGRRSNSANSANGDGHGRPDMSNDKPGNSHPNSNQWGQLPPMMMPFMQMMRMWTDGMSQLVPGGGMAADWM